MRQHAGRPLVPNATSAGVTVNIYEGDVAVPPRSGIND
jgi:hypothetical protein